MNTPEQTKNGMANRDELCTAETSRCARIMEPTAGFMKKYTALPAITERNTGTF